MKPAILNTNDDVILQRTIILPNDIETIPQLNEFIDGVCEDTGIDMANTMNINLALEEAVVNVMTYAYPEGHGEVNIEVTAYKGRITFIITDSGIPFDPTAKEDVDISLSAEERPIGGLGIHLVRQIMDRVSYEYADGKNILTLEKNI